MKYTLMAVMILLLGGCVTSKPVGEKRSTPLIPSQITNAPVSINWEFRDSPAGKKLTIINYNAPEEYIGKTLRILFVVRVQSPSGRKEDYCFMPEAAVRITKRKDSVWFHDYLDTAIGGMVMAEGAKGLGVFRVALYETSDATGGRAEYGSQATFGSTCLLGKKATTIYKNQVSNMLTIERQVQR